MLKLTLIQSRILKLIGKYELTNRNLSKLACVSDQTIFVHVSRLELKGLIIRSGRNNALKLTSLGKKVLKIIKK